MVGSSFKRAVTIAVGFAMALGFCFTSGAQKAETKGAKVHSLNNQLLEVYARQLASPGKGAGAVNSRAAEVIKQRADMLELLIRENPAEALRLGFSQDLHSELAEAFPDATADLESPGVWEGPIEYTIEDNLDLKTHHSIYRMKVGNEELKINFAAAEPKDLVSGNVVRVHGMRIRTEIAAAGGNVTYTTNSPAVTSCSPLGEQKTIVLLVNMPGTNPPAITPQSVADTFFATSGRSTSEFWREASYGATWASGDVKGWYTLDANYTCDQYPSIRDAAIRAADADVDFSQYKRVFVVIAGMSGSCGWAGVSNVGCGSSISTREGGFVVSTSWLLADYITGDYGVELSIHEGGHGLGLSHSSSRDFGVEPLGTPGASGTSSEYGDSFSAMGYWNYGHYTAPQKVQLGWITSDYLTVTGNGSFSINPMESAAPLHALKIRRGTDNNNWLWVEYRQNTGLYDSTLSPQIFSGGLIHYQDALSGSKSNLLDFTGGTDSFADPALAGTWVDPYTNVTIGTAVSAANTLDVSVSYGTIPRLTAAPTVVLSPSNPSAFSGDVVNYTLSVTNNDTSSCALRNFDLSSIAPGTWTTTFSKSSLALWPATSASTTMAKVIPANTPPATYVVDAVAASGSASTEGLANVTIKPQPLPITVSIAPPGGPFKNNSSVTISAKVLQGTAGASAASVQFTVVSPNGASSSKTVTAGATGIATWSYRVGPKDPKGSYAVTAKASLGSQTASAGPETFIVQ